MPVVTAQRIPEGTMAEGGRNVEGRRDEEPRDATTVSQEDEKADETDTASDQEKEREEQPSSPAAAEGKKRMEPSQKESAKN